MGKSCLTETMTLSCTYIRMLRIAGSQGGNVCAGAHEDGEKRMKDTDGLSKIRRNFDAAPPSREVHEA